MYGLSQNQLLLKHYFWYQLIYFEVLDLYVVFVLRDKSILQLITKT